MCLDWSPLGAVSAGVILRGVTEKWFCIWQDLNPLLILAVFGATLAQCTTCFARISTGPASPTSWRQWQSSTPNNTMALCGGCAKGGRRPWMEPCWPSKLERRLIPWAASSKAFRVSGTWTCPRSLSEFLSILTTLGRWKVFACRFSRIFELWTCPDGWISKMKIFQLLGWSLD